MLSAYLYRIRKQALKRPVILILGVLAVAFCVVMLFFPMLMQMDEEEIVVHNNDLIIGAINLILIVVMNFMFFSGLTNGAVGYSFADVNFHLAGPFTPRFNLVIAASGVLKIAAIFLWVFCCQVATLYSAFGVNTADMFGLIISIGFVIVTSYALGAFFCAYFDQNEKAKKTAIAVSVAIEAVFAIVAFLMLLNKYGSFSAIKALGGKGIIAALGSTFAVKAFPIAGWIGLVYSGILLKNILYIILGIVLTLAVFAVIYVLFSRFEINYYETALISAQKVADMEESKKAGIDSDSAKLNTKIKVGKETYNKGWGASAFMHRHFLENKRASKFFFINPLALFYRLFTFVYLFIFASSSDMESMTVFISGLIMILLLNAIVFGGGKTVLEFNRPFIFMIPEKGSKKIMSCLLASIPEMVFDSIVCAAGMWYFAKLSIEETIAIGILFFVFDVLCQLIGVLSVRYMRGLGRVLLTFVRYILIFVISMIAVVPGMIVAFAVNMTVGFFVMAGIGLVINAILLIPASRAIDNVDLA